MQTTTNAGVAREKIIHFIEEIEDTRVISLYEFLKAEMDEEDDWQYPQELKERLDKVDDDIKHNRTENFIEEGELFNRIADCFL